MKKAFILLSLLIAVLLLSAVSCDAPGVKVLDELLPPLTEKTTGYTVTTSITVTRLTTEESVEFTEPTAMDAFHQRLEGIKCISDKKTEGLLPRYTITFMTEEAAETLFVISDTEFILNDVHYEAMRGGIDTVYLESLFPAIVIPDTAETEG